MQPKTKTLITGGAGFIGHHVIDYFLQNTDHDIIILDRLDTSGTLNRFQELNSFNDNINRVKWVWHDLKSEINEFISIDIGEVDNIIHLAASSHVDRSIEDPMSFIMDNVVGTTNLLDWARKGGMKRNKSIQPTVSDGGTLDSVYTGFFINFSTDEVFGPAEPGHNHKENEQHLPSNPYSASKSGQYAIGYAAHVTYGLPVITTYTMNNFGERQHPEKLVPRCIRSILKQEEMPIFAELDFGGNLQAVGSRFWLHAINTASAVKFLLDKGTPGESYNIVGFDEKTNLEMCEKIAEIIGEPLKPKFIDFHETRPGHDRRYSLDGTKLAQLGWEPEVEFDESLKQVVDFTLKNPRWR